MSRRAPAHAIVLLVATTLAACDGPNCKTFPRADIHFQAIHAYGLHAAQAYCMQDMLAESNVILGEAPRSRVQYVVSEEPGTDVQWVAVRGSDNDTNWRADFDRITQRSELLDADLFRGFASASEEVFSGVLPRLDPAKEVRFTGHSLGGAVALILDAMLRRNGEQSGSIWRQGPVITFGQPVVAEGDENEVFCDSQLLRVAIKGDLAVYPWFYDPRNQLEDLDLDVIPDHVGSSVVIDGACGDWDYYAEADDVPWLEPDVCASGVSLDIGNRHHLARYLDLTRKLASDQLAPGESLADHPEIMDCSH
jgi:hypothetical protein